MFTVTFVMSTFVRGLPHRAHDPLARIGFDIDKLYPCNARQKKETV